MNVYFVDPQYVKPEGWKPLLTYLKVKAAYSFIPTDELPSYLLKIIRPYIRASFSNQDYKKFCDGCAFWLRGHFERNVHLITEDFEDANDIPKEVRKKYSSRSALNNIINLDEENCLILLRLVSNFDYTGTIDAPQCYVGELQNSNLPTHIARYCLNILHKKYGHNQFDNQTAFICFDKFLSQAFYYIPQDKRWYTYRLTTTSGKYVNFMYAVNRGINDNEPELFPLIEVDGKKRRFTLLRTAEGDAEFKQFLREAQEAANAYEEEQQQEWKEQQARAEAEDWQREVDQMNRDFWSECGEAGPNCESWPGWD